MNDLCVINGDYQEFPDLNDILTSYSIQFELNLQYSNDGRELIRTYYDLYENGNTKDEEVINGTSIEMARRAIPNDLCIYTCFIFNHFDIKSRLFTKLEEIQAIYSTYQHRIIICGVPMLRYCSANNIVSSSVSSSVLS